MHEVYCHTSPSGKRYVGWTSRGVDKRWREHVKAAGNGGRSFLNSAIRKHGAESFTHELLERMSTEAGAKRAEQLWIARLKTRSPSGYNLTDGGDGSFGVTCSPEKKAKLRAAHLGKTLTHEHRAKLSAAHAGKKPSPKTLAKVLAAHLGSKHTPETKAKMREAWARRGGRTKETLSKLRARRLGTKLSDETRAKLSAAQKLRWARKKEGIQ